MAIYRGPGGSGDATADQANTAQLAFQYAQEAAASAAAAATSFDSFDDRYLGAKASDPSVDNDGNALLTGALYFNTVNNAMRVYNGSSWVDGYVDSQIFLEKANNLSDLTNVATARQNLDLEIGVDVQAYDATILKSADIGVSVQGYDATTLKSADIGVTVQGYDADTAKYDDATANFTGTLQNGGSNVLVDTDIGSTVQAYDSNLTSFVSTFTLPTTDGTADQILKTDGSGTLSFVTAGGGVTITDDTTTNETRYITFTDATTGTETGLDVSSTKLTYNPSTGTLSSPIVAAPILQGTGTSASAGTLELYEDTDNGTNYVAVKAPDSIASNRTITLPDGTGTAVVNGVNGSIVSGTEVTISGNPTSIDFTGIPSWVKRITVMFNGVSTNGTSNYFLQIGDSGGIETTGYVSGVLNGGTVSATATSTSAFLIDASVGAGQVDNGMALIANLSGNLWVCNSILNNAGVSKIQGGTKTLSDTLTQLRITTANGTDGFDAGSINILYE